MRGRGHVSNDCPAPGSNVVKESINLIRLKRIAGRPVDLEDIAALEAIEEREQADDPE